MESIISNRLALLGRLSGYSWVSGSYIRTNYPSFFLGIQSSRTFFLILTFPVWKLDKIKYGLNNG